MASAETNSKSKKLECPVCFQYLLSPIYQCTNGHLLCKECISNLQQCPQCRIKLPSEKIRNLALENIIAEQIFPCNFQEHGCEVTLTGDRIKKHVLHCSYSPVNFCPVLGLKCKEGTARKNNYLEHLINQHGICGSFIEMTEIIQSFEGNHDGVSGSFNEIEWELNYLIPKDTKSFCILLKTKLTNRRMFWRAFAVMNDNLQNVQPPTVKIMLFLDNEETASLSWKGLALKLGENQDYNKPCFNVPVEHLRGSSQWRIRMKICKQKIPTKSDDSFWIYSSIATTESAHHDGIICDHCQVSPILGIRFKCTSCFDFDLCKSCCLDLLIHSHHVFVAITSGDLSKKLGPFLQHPEIPLSYNSGAICDGCDSHTEAGHHFHCTDCFNFDLCEDCFLEKGIHRHHLFVLAPSDGRPIDAMLATAVQSLRARGVVQTVQVHR